jgi:hypothetical protein
MKKGIRLRLRIRLKLKKLNSKYKERQSALNEVEEGGNVLLEHGVDGLSLLDNGALNRSRHARADFG